AIMQRRGFSPGLRRRMTMDRLTVVEQDQLKSATPVFRPGDTVRVQLKVTEGGRERIQAFEGVVTARKGGGVRETFTVRRISHGVGVERIFPVHSPRIERVERSEERRVGQGCRSRRVSAG